jgi:hypothetical protein
LLKVFFKDGFGIIQSQLFSGGFNGDFAAFLYPTIGLKPIPK